MDALIACDTVHPGVLRRYLRGSHLRKQGIALVLSNLDPHSSQELADRLLPFDQHDGFGDRLLPLEFISHIMLHRRVKDIVRTLYPDAHGLTGVIGKLGVAHPISKRSYKALVELLTLPQHRARAAILRHLPIIPEHTIQIVRVLPAHYACFPLLSRQRSVEEANDFARAVELIKLVNPDVADDALRISLKASMPSTTLRHWTKRWLERATKFWVQTPLVDDAEMTVLRSAGAMRDAAKRFENCLESKIADCALGRALYIEGRSPAYIIELECLSEGWVFKSIHGEKNSPVSPATARLALKKLHSAGVQIPTRHWQAVRFNRVARLARIFDPFRDQADLFDDELSDLNQRNSDAL